MLAVSVNDQLLEHTFYKGNINNKEDLVYSFLTEKN